MRLRDRVLYTYERRLFILVINVIYWTQFLSFVLSEWGLCESVNCFYVVPNVVNCKMPAMAAQGRITDKPFDVKFCLLP